MVQTFRRTTEISQLLNTVIDVPVAQVVQVVVIVVVQRRFPMVQTVQQTVVLLQLQFIDKVLDVPVCRFGAYACFKKLGWALCTGTGPGWTPAMRAGKGCRGRREFLPAPLFVACAVRSYRQRHVRYTRVRTTTTTTRCLGSRGDNCSVSPQDVVSFRDPSGRHV